MIGTGEENVESVKSACWKADSVADSCWAVGARSLHWKPALTSMPAWSICSKKPAGMMCPSRRIVFTPMFFISATCVAMSAAE